MFSEHDNCWGTYSVDDLLVFTINRCHDSTVDVGTLDQRQWMPSLLTGKVRITCGVPQLAWSPELFAMHRLVEQWDPWLYHGGFLQHFGLCCVPLIQATLPKERFVSCHM